MWLNLSEVRRLNKLARMQDQSHLWPIRGRFNVTERAIRRVRRLIRAGLDIETPDEYLGLLNQQISEIVNDERNW